MRRTTSILALVAFIALLVAAPAFSWTETGSPLVRNRSANPHLDDRGFGYCEKWDTETPIGGSVMLIECDRVFDDLLIDRMNHKSGGVIYVERDTTFQVQAIATARLLVGTPNVVWKELAPPMHDGTAPCSSFQQSSCDVAQHPGGTGHVEAHSYQLVFTPNGEDASYSRATTYWLTFDSSDNLIGVIDVTRADGIEDYDRIYHSLLSEAGIIHQSRATKALATGIIPEHSWWNKVSWTAPTIVGCSFGDVGCEPVGYHPINGIRTITDYQIVAAAPRATGEVVWWLNYGAGGGLEYTNYNKAGRLRRFVRTRALAGNHDFNARTETGAASTTPGAIGTTGAVARPTYCERLDRNNDGIVGWQDNLDADSVAWNAIDSAQCELMNQ